MDYLVETLTKLCRVPSAVPLGTNTLIDPDAPILVEYVQEHLRSEFVKLGAFDILDLPMNQFAVRFGTGDGPTLALMAYTPTQHNNLMRAPWSGRIASLPAAGADEPCVLGQGVSQNKVHQACLLELCRQLVDEEWSPNGTLFLCVNNEGRSSHACSDAILDALPRTPEFLIQLFPTDFGISIGNRGRVDVAVEVFGEARHSSSPGDGARVIDTAAEIVTSIRALDERLRAGDAEPLGPARALVYQMSFDPLAPHTLPSHARLLVDRRLRLDDDADAAVDEVATALETLRSATDVRVDVNRSVCMLPAFVDSEGPGVDSLRSACSETILDQFRGLIISQGAFDAGGPNAKGVPTVMFGCGGGSDLLGDDFVRISDARREAAVLRRFISDFFTDGHK